MKELEDHVRSVPSLTQIIKKESALKVYASMDGLEIPIKIYGDDVRRVAEKQMINDAIVEVMMCKLKTSIPKDKQDLITIMSPQFYERLRAFFQLKAELARMKPDTKRYETVKNEVAKEQQKIISFTHPRKNNKDDVRTINVFNKHFVCIPIYYSSHFSLVVLTNLGFIECSEQHDQHLPVMNHLDSLPGIHSSESIAIQLREWLTMIYPLQKRDEHTFAYSPIHFNSVTLPVVCPAVDYQDNGVDCGIYVLFFFQLLLWRWPNHITMSDIQNRLKKHFRSQQFTDDDMIFMRIFVLKALQKHMVIEDVKVIMDVPDISDDVCIVVPDSVGVIDLCGDGVIDLCGDEDVNPGSASKNDTSDDCIIVNSKLHVWPKEEIDQSDDSDDYMDAMCTSSRYSDDDDDDDHDRDHDGDDDGDDDVFS